MGTPGSRFKVQGLGLVLIGILCILAGCASTPGPHVLGASPGEGASAQPPALSPEDAAKIRVVRKTVTIKDEEGKPAMNFITFYLENGDPMAFVITDGDGKVLVNIGGKIPKGEPGN